MNLFRASSVVGTVILLAGCSESVDPNAAYLSQKNTETEIAKKLVQDLKKSDPSVTDAYFSLNKSGERVLNVVRDKGDGNLEVTEVPHSILKQIEEKSTSEASSSSSSSLPMIMAAGLAGYMMGGGFNNSSSSMMNRENYDRNRAFAGSAYSSYLTKNATNMSSQKVARSISKTSGGSFTSSGARSSGYSSGG